MGFTSATGQERSLAQWEFDRGFSLYFLNWMTFGVLTLPPIGLQLWNSSKRKCDTPEVKKK